MIQKNDFFFQMIHSIKNNCSYICTTPPPKLSFEMTLNRCTNCHTTKFQKRSLLLYVVVLYSIVSLKTYAGDLKYIVYLKYLI